MGAVKNRSIVYGPPGRYFYICNCTFFCSVNNEQIVYSKLMPKLSRIARFPHCGVFVVPFRTRIMLRCHADRTIARCTTMHSQGQIYRQQWSLADSVESTFPYSYFYGKPIAARPRHLFVSCLCSLFMTIWKNTNECLKNHFLHSLIYGCCHLDKCPFVFLLCR